MFRDAPSLDDVVLMNPPFGGKDAQTRFPYKTGATQVLFLQHFIDSRKLPTRGDRERSWTVTRQQVEAKNLDLKALNPNRKSTEDTRTPDALLAFIKGKGQEVSAALAALSD